MKNRFLFFQFLFLLIIPLNLFPEWFLVNGKYNEEWRVEVTSEIKTKNHNIVTILDFFDPINYSNMMNAQEITALSSTIKGEKYVLNKIISEDSELNRFIIKFLDKDYFFINKSYKIKTQLSLNYSSYDSFYQPKNNPENPFLRFYEDIPEEFIKTIEELVKNKKKNSDVVLSIYSWIKNYFIFSLKTESSAIKEVYKKKEANLEEILNIWIYALRVAKIPARIIHGYSLPFSLILKENKNKFIFTYPHGLYHWIEFYFDGIGWIPLDPFNDTLFFVPHNLIRKTNSFYFNSNQDKIYVYPKYPKDMSFSHSVFSEKTKSEEKLTIQAVLGSENLLITPPLVSEEKPTKKNVFFNEFFPSEFGVFSNPLKIDMEVTEKEPLSQKLYFEKTKKGYSVTLPLYFLEINQFGEFWLELQVQGKTYKSFSLKPNFSRISIEYTPVTFVFPELIHFKDEVILTLKVKNISAVFWYGVIGNPTGDSHDTFKSENEYYHVDMCYKFNFF